MARFIYRMQSILDVKSKLEETAKQEFSHKQLLLVKEEEKLAKLIKSKEHYEEEAVRLRTGSLDFLKIQENQNALNHLELEIKTQRERIRERQKEVEEAREKLAELMKERKAQEILKEKAFEQFLQDEKNAESKEVDELTSYTFGKKTKVSQE